VKFNLFEDESTDSPVSGMIQQLDEPPDSVDDQIDSFLIKYEKEAIDSGEEDSEEEKMFESLEHLTLRFLLEQDENPDEPADPAVGSETPKSSPKSAEEKKPPLDIDLFTKKIARLVMNASTLLQVEEVIISRALQFLKKNYGQSYAESMQDILDRQYDFDLEGEENVVDVPIAAGAGVKSAGG
jgi:hypothetical protein